MNNIELSKGTSLPQVGLGFWKVSPEDAAQTVIAAIDAGYRHLDSAADYGNEAAVGEGIVQAIRAGQCSREELWVTSKLWNTDHKAEHVRPALERTLRDLQLDYLDLYMIHFPIALEYVDPAQRYPAEWFFEPSDPKPAMKPAKVPIYETWRAMEELVDAGLVKHIGVCNFGVSLLRDLLNYARIPPAVLQVELHPRLSQQKLLRFCADNDIGVTGFSPLGALSYVDIDMAQRDDSVLELEVIRTIASRAQRSPAQVVLRWAIQRGTAIIPKTTRPERLRENLALFDFELSEEEMKAIDSLNEDRRFNDPGHFCEAAFNTFFPIYE
ncbi:MAG: aldo/keto reductase [Pseudomonadota bacterium]